MEQYRNIKTKEIVYKEEAQNYIENKLGIKIEPKGVGSTYTLEQIEYLQAVEEWYFSDNWILEEV